MHWAERSQGSLGDFRLCLVTKAGMELPHPPVLPFQLGKNELCRALLLLQAGFQRSGPASPWAVLWVQAEQKSSQSPPGGRDYPDKQPCPAAAVDPWPRAPCPLGWIKAAVPGSGAGVNPSRVPWPGTNPCARATRIHSDSVAGPPAGSRGWQG